MRGNPVSLTLALVTLALILLVHSTSGLASTSTESQWTSAISNDRTDQLSRLLSDHETATELIALSAPNGKDALMVACKQGELALAKRLVAKGADIHNVTHTGGTPFMFAVLGNHLPIAQWLHNLGSGINAKGSNGWSAATIAAAKGQHELLSWLVSIGADMDAPDVYQLTPLMRAVDNRHVDASRVLLDAADVKLNHRDETGNTALHYAVANADVTIIKLLLGHGADPSIANRDGLTPAGMASESAGVAELFSSD